MNHDKIPTKIEPLLKVKSLNLSFANNHVLKNLNFEIYPNERVVILGPSGAGKSVFLRCLNRLEEPTSGEIYFKNELVTPKNITKIRPKIGMVFQHFNLIKNFTVLENLTFAPIELGLYSPEIAEGKAKKLLREIGLLKKVDAYPETLSGGQKQRVAILRSLMLNPELLLFDEPTSALDPDSIEDVLDLIRSVAKTGKTMIFITHELSFAKEIATRTVYLEKGKIIAKKP